MILEPSHSTERSWICINCRPLLAVAPADISSGCRGAFIYDDVVRDLIHDIKFRSHRRAAFGLGAIMAETINEWGLSGDYIVPVPLHPSKKRSRGFNQAAEIALPISRALGIPIANDMIRRTRKTEPQSGLSVTAREENLSDAFVFNNNKYKSDKNPRKIILFDDIFTSGATMNACKKLLTENNTKEIVCISLSITVFLAKS